MVADRNGTLQMPTKIFMREGKSFSRTTGKITKETLTNEAKPMLQALKLRVADYTLERAAVMAAQKITAESIGPTSPTPPCPSAIPN